MAHIDRIRQLPDVGIERVILCQLKEKRNSHSNQNVGKRIPDHAFAKYPLDRPIDDRNDENHGRDASLRAHGKMQIGDNEIKPIRQHAQEKIDELGRKQ